MDITRIDPQAAMFACRSHHRDSKGYHQQFLSWMPPGAARVLDVGSGPGFMALQLAEFATFVVGVDSSPAMIGLARKNQSESGKANVAWVIASADALPFRTGTFDYIASTFALRFSNLHCSLPEIRRTIRPGGRVAIRDSVTRAPRLGFWLDYSWRVMRFVPKLLRHYGLRGTWNMLGYQLSAAGVQNARHSQRLRASTFVEIYERYFPEKKGRHIFSAGKLFWENVP
ncbi:MAG: class I SAM-dependent methyltransferase [Alphaproteobacteria bacterium]